MNARNITDKKRFSGAKMGLFIGSTGLLIIAYLIKGDGPFSSNYFSEAYSVGALTGYLTIICISIYQKIRETKIKNKEKINALNYFFFFAGMVLLFTAAFTYFYLKNFAGFIFLWVSFAFFVILVTRNIADKFIQ